MKVKRGLLYTASHEWVDFMPDGTARVGISDFVPQKRGKISFLNLCDEGEYYQSGEVIGDAEAFKGVWDISAPISGTVLRINDDLLDDPQSINSDPYGSWLAEFGDAERRGGGEEVAGIDRSGERDPAGPRSFWQGERDRRQRITNHHQG